jgi:alpha-D-ribose 1-methylphosphonate 5-triphosphate synthase subunit PhnG
VYDPHQRLLIIAFFSTYILKGFCRVLGRDEREAYLHHIILTYILKGFGRVLGRDEREAYLHHIILLSQKPDPRRCKSYTLIKKCKCVKF